MGNIRAIRRKRIEVKEISIIQAITCLLIFVLSNKILAILVQKGLLIVSKQRKIITNGESVLMGSIIVLILQIIQTSIIVRIFTNKHTLKKHRDGFYFKELKERYNKKGKYVTLIFLIIIGITLFRNGTYSEIICKFEGPVSPQELDNLVKTTTTLELLEIMSIFLFSAIVTAPILEEVIFRGIIFKGLFNKYEKPLVAIMISALLFAIGHLNIPQGINAFILGLILATIDYYTDSLTLSMMAHSIANILAVVPTPKTIYMKITFTIVGGGCLTIGMKSMINKSKVNQLKFA